MHWIPVSQPPAKFNRYLLVWGDNFWHEGGYTKTDGFYAYFDEDRECEITHYMLIEPPP
jgi:hypothetical protein